MKQLITRITALIAMFIFVITPNVEAATDGTAELVIFHTNDLHARVNPEDDNGQTIGLAEMSAAIKAIEMKNSTSLWLDAGDTFHGMPQINISQGENMVTLLNATTLDAMVPGNHDYNYGAEQLKNFRKKLNAMILCANVVQSNSQKYIFKPYQIYKLSNNIKVGVFGLTTPETVYKSNPNNTVGIEFLDPIEQAKDMVEKMRSKCDVLIALTHIGIEEGSKITSDIIAKEVPGIDLIVDGHSHNALPDGLMVDDTLIVQTGWHGHKLGRVTISLNNHKITAKKAELLSAEDVSEIAPNPDPGVKKILKNIEQRNSKLLKEVVAHSDRGLASNQEVVRRQESELGNLAADSFRWKTGADIAVINGGGLRADLPSGDVRRGDVMSIFVFGNTVQVAKIKGSAIREMLEHSIYEYPASFAGFLSVSGMTYSFNPSKPVGHRVDEIRIGGKPLDEEKTYKIASLDFLFAGGDGYDMLKEAEVIVKYQTAEEIMSEYMGKIGMGDIKVGRIKIIKESEVPENTTKVKTEEKKEVA